MTSNSIVKRVWGICRCSKDPKWQPHIHAHTLFILHICTSAWGWWQVYDEEAIGQLPSPKPCLSLLTPSCLENSVKRSGGPKSENWSGVQMFTPAHWHGLTRALKQDTSYLAFFSFSFSFWHQAWERRERIRHQEDIRKVESGQLSLVPSRSGGEIWYVSPNGLTEIQYYLLGKHQLFLEFL